MKVIKKFDIFLNESLDGISYEIVHPYNLNIYVHAKINDTVIGSLEILDDTPYFDGEDDELTLTIYMAFVDAEYRRKNIYINLIKYFLRNNKYNVKTLCSYNNPEFDDEPRSLDATNFWEYIYKNQSKYKVRVDKHDGCYEITLK